MISNIVLIVALKSDFILITPTIIPLPIAVDCKKDPKNKQCQA